MLEVLAALSASAAGGMRIALPLLIVGLIQGQAAWSSVPLLGRIPAPVLFCILVSWSLFELFANKSLLGQRTQQALQLFLSPLVGALLAMTVIQQAAPAGWVVGLMAGIGGVLALVIYLAQAGWFYRMHGLPLWVVVGEDILCIFLVCFAFGAPAEGGLIALLLLWLVIRSSSEWYRWFRAQRSSDAESYGDPRYGKLEPD